MKIISIDKVHKIRISDLQQPVCGCTFTLISVDEGSFYSLKDVWSNFSKPTFWKQPVCGCAFTLTGFVEDSISSLKDVWSTFSKPTFGSNWYADVLSH